MNPGGESEICRKVYEVPPIVLKHARRNPQLNEEITAVCRKTDPRRCVLWPEDTGTSFEKNFCSFQHKVEKLEWRLNALHQERLRWVNKAESAWRGRMEQLGRIKSATADKDGDLSLSVWILHDSLVVAVNPYVLGEATETGRILLDQGFAVYFDTPAAAERWLRTNLARLPSVFSDCEPRLEFVDLRDNMFVDNLYGCWKKRAEAQGIPDPWWAWQVAFHSRSLLGSF